MKKIWFIRHGESAGNAGLTIPNAADIELTDIGHEQAHEVSEKLLEKPDLIVATPYIRTQLTAEPTRKKFPNTPYEIWDMHEFTQLDADSYINASYPELEPKEIDYWTKTDPDFVYGEGAESFTDLLTRINDTLEQIANRSEEFIVIFAHAAILRTMVNMLNHPNLTPQEIMIKSNPYSENFFHIRNCEIIKAKYNGNSFELLNF